jgi:hypothetical protein
VWLLYFICRQTSGYAGQWDACAGLGQEKKRAAAWVQYACGLLCIAHFFFHVVFVVTKERHYAEGAG